jgi:hypothetical protein
MKAKSFFFYYGNMFIHPSRTYQQLLISGDSLKFGLLAALIPAVGYTLFYIMASSAGGAPSTFKPWLAIPIEEYFRYDIFLVAPSLYLGLIASSGVVQLISKLFHGKGTYENTVAVIGFGIGVATWSTMLHDLSDAGLGFLGIIDLREYEAILNAPTFWRGLLLTLFAIYFIWFLVLFTKGIEKAHGLSGWKSMILAFVALIIYQGVFLIFNR